MKTGTHFTRPFPHAAPGLTLIELLVVIVIIAVLATAGFAGFGNLKAKSMESKCSMQLRQWSTAINGYSGDNAGRICFTPWAAGSTNPDDSKTSPYMRYFVDASGLFACRKCPGHEWVPTAGSNPPPTYVFIRPNTSGAVAGPNLGYYSRFSIARPSELLLMIDALPNSGAVISGASGFDEWVKPTCEGDNVRHRGRANMLFADGRVEGRHYTRKDASDNEAIEANRDKWLRLDPTN